MTEQLAIATVAAARLARTEDRDALMALDAGGTGGLRERRGRIDAWVGDRSGALLVADDPAEGVVGTARVICHGPDEWWLQGVRVAAHARRRGVATTLWGEAIRWAGEQSGAPGVLRLCCEADNAGGHRLARGSGCTAVGEFVRLFAAAGAASLPTTGTFRQVTDRHVAIVRRLLDDSQHFRASDRLTFARPVVGKVVDGDRLRRLVSKARVHTWCPPWSPRDAAAVVIHRTVVPAEGWQRQQELVVGALAAPDDLLTMFASDLVRLGRQLGCAGASMFVADDPDRLAALGAAGWSPLPGRRGRGTIYRRRLAGDR